MAINGTFNSFQTNHLPQAPHPDPSVVVNLINSEFNCPLSNKPIICLIKDQFKQKLPYIVAAITEIKNHQQMICLTDAFQHLSKINENMTGAFFICKPTDRTWSQFDPNLIFLSDLQSSFDPSHIIHRIVNACDPTLESTARGQERFFLYTHFENAEKDTELSKYWLSKAIEDNNSAAFIAKATHKVNKFNLNSDITEKKQKLFKLIDLAIQYSSTTEEEQTNLKFKKRVTLFYEFYAH